MKENYCSTCGQEFKPSDLSVRCSLCMRNYHARCWEKTGGCTTWGCAGKSSLEQDHEPVSYVRCPFCGEDIVSFAIKCRYCRSVVVPPDSLPVEMAHKKPRNRDDSFRKDPILTSLLNLIFPGAGYMYLGQFNKGLMWFFIAIAAWFFTRGLGVVVVYIWVMYDSAREALRYNREIRSGSKTMQRP